MNLSIKYTDAAILVEQNKELIVDKVQLPSKLDLGGSWAPGPKVWDGLGPLLGALGRFLAVFWTFKIELFSSMGPR